MANGKGQYRPSRPRASAPRRGVPVQRGETWRWGRPVQKGPGPPISDVAPRNVSKTSQQTNAPASDVVYGGYAGQKDAFGGWAKPGGKPTAQGPSQQIGSYGGRGGRGGATTPYGGSIGGYAGKRSSNPPPNETYGGSLGGYLGKRKGY